MDKKFRFYNIVLGWATFLLAAFTYLMTIEPTTSLWDCGEFISTAFKLQVGHPPGAPLFMIAARLFSLFAGSDTGKVAMMVNAMSALASAFTILFLFWTISHLARKILIAEGEYTTGKIVTILGSALVGSLAFTFSDSFWFSAVEGEVYASSSLFTALVFWAILKWENVADEKHSNRWIILIAYLMGLSIGVHLLNLLAIPAIVFVYYYRKMEVNRKNTLLALLVSVLLLGGVMYVIIPGVVKVAAWFELFFVNGLGLPFNTGVIIYAILLTAAIVFGIRYATRKGKVILHTIITGVTVIIIGYSSFAMLVIRAEADPPMDENSPDNVFSLLSYLNREQYGDRPLLYGQYYNAPPVDMKETTPTYSKINGRYEITYRKPEYIFDSRFTTIFPRMYSADPDHIKAYKDWANIKGEPIRWKNPQTGETQTIYKPTFFENLKFFLTYQVGHMYIRYFMWNFVGRQNDNQADGSILNGQWLSGIKFIDSIFLGSQDKLPDSIKNDPSRNKYYLLPLLLGLMGLLYQMQKDERNFWVITLLFILTGLAIVVYLNQTPNQPRERDYAYAGSYYAFAIWIGLGVAAIADFFSKSKAYAVAAVAVTLLCLLAVPGIMANENWNDHDRSGRYTARDFAADYLKTCAPNAILFTVGDNDTFPLWYCQEVEGIRTDVRVVNLMLLNTDWYIDQMKRKAYDSDPVPFSLTREQYIHGTRNYMYLMDRVQSYVNLKEAVDFVASDDPKTKTIPNYPEKVDYIPTQMFSLPVDTSVVFANGTLRRSQAGMVVSPINWKLNRRSIGKSELMVMDLLAHNNWKRPVYFDAPGSEGTIGLDDYLQLEGFAWRLVPIKTPGGSYLTYGRIDSDILFDNLMNKFSWGRMNEPDVHVDYHVNRTISVMKIRNVFNRLAEQLLYEGKEDSAIQVLDRIVSLTPDRNVPYDMFTLHTVNLYYSAGAMEKASALSRDVANVFYDNLRYYLSLNPKFVEQMSYEINVSQSILGDLLSLSKQFKQAELATELERMVQSTSAMNRPMLQPGNK